MRMMMMIIQNITFLKGETVMFMTMSRSCKMRPQTQYRRPMHR